MDFAEFSIFRKQIRNVEIFRESSMDKMLGSLVLKNTKAPTHTSNIKHPRHGLQQRGLGRRAAAEGRCELQLAWISFS